MSNNMNNPQNNGFGGQMPPYNPQNNGFGGQMTPYNTLAIVSLVAIFLFWPAALVCGIIARRQIAQTGERGYGMALAGIIVGGIVGVISILIAIAIAIPTFNSLSHSTAAIYFLR